jgi:membrane protein YqaA with SNARE-associated domain
VDTFQVIILAGSWARSVFRFFRRLGIFGLLLVSALDSSFLVLPFGNDLLLIGLVSSDRHGPMWIAYVLISVLGSMLGVLVLDVIMRKTGEKGLERFLKKQKIHQLRDRISDKAGLTVFMATVLPPPFPFTPVVMTASALQVSRRSLLGSVFLGRLVRFTLEAILAIYFGRKIIQYMNSKAVEYIVYGLIAIAVVGSVFSILKWVGRSTSSQSTGATTADS